MYIPAYFEEKDRKKILSFIRKYNFATLVANGNSHPMATHLPFLIEEHGDKIFITSHMAKANPQAKMLEQNEVLVIFCEPHAYISPSLYESKLNVPTWNYVAVHLYGSPKLIIDPQRVTDVLVRTIRTFEENFEEQWEELPLNYKEGLMKELVAFEIEVKKIEAQFKLSRNKTITERKRISEALKISNDTNISSIGKMMEEELE